MGQGNIRMDQKKKTYDRGIMAEGAAVGRAAAATTVRVGAGNGSVWSVGAAQADRTSRTKRRATARRGRVVACMAADSPSRHARRQLLAANAQGSRI